MSPFLSLYQVWAIPVGVVLGRVGLVVVDFVGVGFVGVGFVVSFETLGLKFGLVPAFVISGLAGVFEVPFASDVSGDF